MIKIIIITIAVVLSLFILILFGSNILSWREDYGCDIGENEIAGDYELTSSSWFEKWYNERSCAIEDCAAYNKHQKDIGSKLRCVV